MEESSRLSVRHVGGVSSRRSCQGDVWLLSGLAGAQEEAAGRSVVEAGQPLSSTASLGVRQRRRDTTPQSAWSRPPTPAATQSCPPSEVPSSKASEGARERCSVSADSAFGPPDDEAALKEL